MSGECDVCGQHTVECECDQLCDDHIIVRKTLSKKGYKSEWGFHNLMVLAAFRYCLGRTSYIVSCCTDWIISYWPEIDKDNKNRIHKEIREAIDKGWAGDQCDIANWKKVLKLEMD